MIAGPARRLAGFRFETRSLQKDESLPRMDVAVFVGFAASGPLHKPVATESPEEFKEIFGADVKLAWNAERGEDHYGYLGPAVRAFFRNGGKRCWVVRVAGAAEYNVFTVPGMALANCNGSITPAFLRARSEGSWSDNLRIAAAVQVTRESLSEAGVPVHIEQVNPLLAGNDLLSHLLPLSPAPPLRTPSSTCDRPPA